MADDQPQGILTVKTTQSQISRKSLDSKRSQDSSKKKSFFIDDEAMTGAMIRQQIREKKSYLSIASTIGSIAASYADENKRKLKKHYIAFGITMGFCFLLTIAWTLVFIFFQLSDHTVAVHEILEIFAYAILLYETVYSWLYSCITLLKFFYGYIFLIDTINEIIVFVHNTHFLLMIPLVLYDVIYYRTNFRRLIWDSLNENTLGGDFYTWSITQKAGKCCGIDKHSDWDPIFSEDMDMDGSSKTYPKDCCKEMNNMTMNSGYCLENNTWTGGCYKAELNTYITYSGLILALELASCIVFFAMSIVHKRLWKFAEINMQLSVFLDKVTDTTEANVPQTELPV